MTTAGKPPLGERMATAETWIVEHDKVCSDRFSLLLKVIGFGGMVILAVVSGGVGLFHEEQTHQTQILQGISAQVNAQAAHTTVMVNPTPTASP